MSIDQFDPLDPLAEARKKQEEAQKAKEVPEEKKEAVAKAGQNEAAIEKSIKDQEATEEMELSDALVTEERIKQIQKSMGVDLSQTSAEMVVKESVIRSNLEEAERKLAELKLAEQQKAGLDKSNAAGRIETGSDTQGKTENSGIEAKAA